MAEMRTREIAVVAQDPGVKPAGGILTAEVSVPWEDLEPGPIGHRICVIDYDASTGTMYKPAPVGEKVDALRPPDNDLLAQPDFHARNAYALAMRTLECFERALGRRVGWGFRAPQLKVVPHAFEQMNAFYSRDAESLVFGYYRAPGEASAATGQGKDEWHFTCLSHDIVVHETSHALLDGLRSRYMAPSSPDQAAFHEGFSDIVALLSVFSLEDVLKALLVQGESDGPEGLVRLESVTTDALMRSVLLGLAEQMGAAMASARKGALRRSVEIEPHPGILDRIESRQAHRRGEILVAAVMRTFVDAWVKRLGTLGQIDGEYLDLGRVVEEGATIADVLLTMAIRAIDYMPPIHLEFGDYLSAMLTADSEARGGEGRYGLQAGLRDWFGRYGIQPASGAREGRWVSPQSSLDYDGIRFQGLQDDPIEMYRLLWANRKALRLDPSAYTRVASLRPSVRTSPQDGMPVRETVAECTQYVKLPAGDLGVFGLSAPAGMPADREVTLEGGTTLILDEYGRLKYDIHNRLPSPDDEARLARAQRRLQHLWDEGAFDADLSFAARLASIHRLRTGLETQADRDEVW